MQIQYLHSDFTLLTAEKEATYITVLTEALQTGYGALQAGKSSLDAVAPIHIVEEFPLFNAGNVAVFTHDGRNGLDTSIMDGKI